MKNVFEIYEWVTYNQEAMDSLTFSIFKNFYTKMISSHGGLLTLPEIEKKITREMLELGEHSDLKNVQEIYAAKDAELKEIRLFSKLTKSILNQ